MSNRIKALIAGAIIIFSIIVVVVIWKENASSSNNPIAGNYRGDVLSMELKNNNTFYYYNGTSSASAQGKYSFTLSSDGSKANVKFQTTSGSCPYDGAVIYFFDDATWLSPTINNYEVVPRKMVKVS